MYKHAVALSRLFVSPSGDGEFVMVSHTHSCTQSQKPQTIMIWIWTHREAMRASESWPGSLL